MGTNALFYSQRASLGAEAPEQPKRRVRAEPGCGGPDGRREKRAERHRVVLGFAIREGPQSLGGGGTGPCGCGAFAFGASQIQWGRECPGRGQKGGRRGKERTQGKKKKKELKNK